MVIRRLTGEWIARLLLLSVIAGLLSAVTIGRGSAQAVEIHAMMPEQGGWLPGALTAKAGVPLNLRLTSDDVMHGFAVGQQPWPAVDVKPGQITELSLTFEKPGTYTYYCTRWCGPNHWRMRGTIEVTGEQNRSLKSDSAGQPLYATLGLDIDAPHNVDVNLDQRPSSSRGDSLQDIIPTHLRAQEVYLEQTPYEVWQTLRAKADMTVLNDMEIWDLVAFVWGSQTTPETIQLGQRLYADNCAACHGAEGDGAGVLAIRPESETDPDDFGGALLPPSDFTDSRKMLGVSSAVLQGKIIRGGMGTGMPYWGTIFTDEEILALIDYIWTFQFPVAVDE